MMMIVCLQGSGDTCIISSSGSCLGRGSAIELSENKRVAEEEASLSFASWLPRDASRSYSIGERRRRSRSRTSNMWKSRFTLTLSTRAAQHMQPLQHSRICPEGQLLRRLSDSLSVTFPTKCTLGAMARH
jgi:hypothetical protein